MVGERCSYGDLSGRVFLSRPARGGRVTARGPFHLGCALAALLMALATADARGQAPPDDPATFFELKIRPVLAGTCFKCHGGDKVANGLRVDSREALVGGGDSGPAIVPQEPQQSLLVHALRRDDQAVAMPPDDALPAPVVADFVTWIRQGAPWPAVEPAEAAARFGSAGHWAFKPVRDSQPPEDPTGWSKHPVDRFILAKLRARGLEPLGPADRQTLIRRTCFDLLGLPPSPEEVTAFVEDDGPEVFASLVERWLASPRYGERWGRHWMDVARYADTAGDNADYPVPEARLYRDYIIDAFHADKPYDEFVREQLAGDILAADGPREKYAERVIATGFLALSRRYATAPYELWHLTLEDTIETVGRAFLGLSLRCARCHDHKFDPVTTADYYALYGIFASTKFPYAGSEEFQSKKFNRADFMPLAPPAECEPQIEVYRRQIADLQAQLKQTEQQDPLAKELAVLAEQLKTVATVAPVGASATLPAETVEAQGAALEKRRKEIHAQLEFKLNPLRRALRALERLGLPADVPGAYAVNEGSAADASIQIRGNPAEAGPVVPRGPPKFQAAMQTGNRGDDPAWEIPPGASGRRQLADWLTRPEHPLTARVLVNRVWQHHLGRGIVATPSNFGLRGAQPTHPELLDWLTARFVASGWSIKSLHRLILSSKTYQLASGHSDHNATHDPGNQWYWRHDRRRLDAESIRDAMLTASGRLDLARPQGHPFPPITDWGWTQHTPFKAVYPSNHRSVYLMTQRIQRHPYLALFDGPDTNYSTDVRTTATVPLQALYLLNDPFVHEQAAGFAERLIAAAPGAQGRIELACRTAWGRPPRPVESEKLLTYLDHCTREFGQAGVPSGEVEQQAWSSLARILLAANEFVYVD